MPDPPPPRAVQEFRRTAQDNFSSLGTEDATGKGVTTTGMLHLGGGTWRYIYTPSSAICAMVTWYGGGALHGVLVTFLHTDPRLFEKGQVGCKEGIYLHTRVGRTAM